MGFWSRIKGACSAVCRGACKVLGAVGRSAVSLVRNVSIGLGKVVGSVWGGIGKVLGILKPQEEPEEIGEMAVQGAEQGVNREQFKTNQEYIQALRDKVKFDRDRFNKLSEQELHERRMLGTKITAQGIEEHMGIPEIPNNFIVASGMLGWSPSLTLKMLETSKKNDVPISDITDYMKNRCKADKIEKTGDAIKEAVKAENPGLTVDQVNQNILDAQKKIKDENLDIPNEEEIEEATV